MTRLAAAILLFVAASAAAAPKTALAPACADRIAALRARFEASEHLPRPEGLFLEAGMEPPRGNRGPVLDRSFIVVERTLKATRVDGQPAEWTAAAIRPQIEAFLNRRRILDPTGAESAHVGLVLDRRIAAREVLAMIEDLGAAQAVDLLTREDSPAAPPPPPLPARVAARMAAIRGLHDFQERMPLMQKTVAESLSGCPGHEAFFGDLKTGDPAGEAHDLHQSILAAAAACSCVGIDLDMLAAVVLSMDDNPPVVFHARPLQVRKKAKRELVLPSTATVEDLAAQLPDGPFAVRWAGNGPTR